MKKLLPIVFLGALLTSASAQVYPWHYYGTDLDGTPLTNAITVEAWPNTNTIVGVSTNLVVSFAKTYYPTNPAGFYSNNLAPGNYRLTVAGQTRGITFGIVSNGSPQNLAQVAGVPVVTYLNFALAQFSDVGTAAYSNATAFALRTYAGVSNAVGFVIATNSLAGITSALGYTPATNTYAGISNSVGFVLATNSTAGITGALGYTPMTNSLAWTTTSNPTNQFAVNTLYTNAGPRGFLVGFATGSTLHYTNNGLGFTMPVTNAPFCVPLSTNATFTFDNAGTLTNTVLWY